MTMSDDEYFLFVCEKLCRLSEEGKTLLTRATKAADARDEEAVDGIADGIETNRVKRRLLLARIYEMVQPSAG